MTNKTKGMIITVVCVIFCLLPIVAGFILFDKLPDTIPIHFDSEGTADKFVGKLEGIFILPLIFTIITVASAFIFRSFIERNLKVFGSLLMIWPLSSCALQGMVLFKALGKDAGAMTTAMVVVGLFCIAIGNYMPTVRPNGLVGARFPWIMDDDEAWEKTQRFTGKLFVALGITYIIEGFANWGGDEGATIWLMASMLLVLVVSGIYSYMVAQNG